jgi:hypothetical protein
MQSINAVFVTNQVKRWLATSSQPRILHVFDEVCNLTNEKKEIVSIVNAEIGNGPFNLLIDEPMLFTKHLDSGSNVSLHDQQISIGDLAISYAHAQTWDPMPRWDELRNNRDEIANRLRLLQIESENEAILRFSDSLSLAIITMDLPAVKTGASKLAGLGVGLTPAGDDFLMGVMYAAWVIHPQEAAKKITEEIATIASSITTSLSGAWLKSAARGEAGEVWHELFDAFLEDKNMYVPISNILSVGATSGSDAFAGFVEVLARWSKM